LTSQNTSTRGSGLSLRVEEKVTTLALDLVR
jgi:hypothetical protein